MDAQCYNDCSTLHLLVIHCAFEPLDLLQIVHAITL